jgi:hypothetical protein
MPPQPIGATVSLMTETGDQALCVHVLPDGHGAWTVQSDESDDAASVHADATAASHSAKRHARACGAELVIVHDRYANLHVTAVGT